MKMKPIKEYLFETIKTGNAMKPYKGDMLFIVKVGDKFADTVIVDDIQKINNDSNTYYYEITTTTYNEFEGWRTYYNTSMNHSVGVSSLNEDEPTNYGHPECFGIKINNNIYIIGLTRKIVLEKSKDKDFLSTFK